MGTLRDAVEATLVGRDHRLVERCDVDGILDGILTALDLYGIYDVEVLVENLQTSFGALQTQLGESAPPSFLALLKAQLGRSQPHTPPPNNSQPHTPSTTAPPGSCGEAVSVLPVVVTAKFNGKPIAERSSLQVPATATWEEVARLRLSEQAPTYASMSLKVDLFLNGHQRDSDRVGAAISDYVGGTFALGYSFAMLSFSAPIYGCVRPAAKGTNTFAEMMAAARGGATLCLPEPYKASEEGVSLNFELALFNAIILQFMGQDIGVRPDERSNCEGDLVAVRNAVWLFAGREREFKGELPKRFKEYSKPCEEGGFGVKLGKKPQGLLTQDKVRSAASKLRTQVDNNKFARSPLWEEFRDDCDQLHTLLLAKVQVMKAAATSEAERREVNADKPADLKPSFLAPNLTGTAPKYATLEALLMPMRDCEVLSLPEKECLKLHPPSDAAMAGKDLNANR